MSCITSSRRIAALMNGTMAPGQVTFSIGPGPCLAVFLRLHTSPSRKGMLPGQEKVYCRGKIDLPVRAVKWRGRVFSADEALQLSHSNALAQSAQPGCGTGSVVSRHSIENDSALEIARVSGTRPTVAAGDHTDPSYGDSCTPQTLRSSAMRFSTPDRREAAGRSIFAGTKN